MWACVCVPTGWCVCTASVCICANLACIIILLCAYIFLCTMSQLNNLYCSCGEISHGHWTAVNTCLLWHCALIMCNTCPLIAMSKEFSLSLSLRQKRNGKAIISVPQNPLLPKNTSQATKHTDWFPHWPWAIVASLHVGSFIFNCFQCVSISVHMSYYPPQATDR